MGDYTKLIVNCSVKLQDEEELKLKLEEFYFSSSMYHCGGEVLHVDSDNFRTNITIVSQHKYSEGIEEFLSWLQPQVIDGFGKDEIFAISCTEYCTEPKIYKLNESVGD
jgi:hypothetical protein